MEKAPGAGGIRLSYIDAFLQNGMGRKNWRLSNG